MHIANVDERAARHSGGNLKRKVVCLHSNLHLYTKKKREQPKVRDTEVHITGTLNDTCTHKPPSGTSNSNQIASTAHTTKVSTSHHTTPHIHQGHARDLDRIKKQIQEHILARTLALSIEASCRCQKIQYKTTRDSQQPWHHLQQAAPQPLSVTLGVVVVHVAPSLGAGEDTLLRGAGVEDQAPPTLPVYQDLSARVRVPPGRQPLAQHSTAQQQGHIVCIAFGVVYGLRTGPAGRRQANGKCVQRTRGGPQQLKATNKYTSTKYIHMATYDVT